jgi:serine protease AprX
MRSVVGNGLWVGLCGSMLAMVGCALGEPGQDDGDPAELREVETDLAEPADTGKLYSVQVRNGALSNPSVSEAPFTVARTGVNYEPKAMALAPSAPASKIDEHLEAQLQRAAAAATNAAVERVEVVVTYKETIKLPRFPVLNAKESRGSIGNQLALQRADQLVKQVAQTRAPEHATHTAELAARYGGRVTETFWLINGLVVELPLDQVRALAAQPDVQFVEHSQKPIPPPANNSIDARTLMNTEPYFGATAPNGFIGLLDTGIRLTHTLLSHVDFRRDCVNGIANNCTSGLFLDPSDNFWNHGTSSASELTANGNLGANHRGVTAITVDSWKIYNNAGLVIAAAVRGFQAAVASGDRVIVAEIQDTGGEAGATSTAADQAFDAGAIVVAAAGNFGSGGGSVRAPGIAHKALAVGAVDVTSSALQGYSGRGAAADGRTKPDVLGPTNVNAASNASDTAMQLFTGTSAATPNVAGATALMWNFFGQAAPGFLNAVMILTGRNFASPAFDNNNGAGIVFLPVNGNIFSSSVVVGPGGTVDVPINVAGSIQSVEASIWWPEVPGGAHNDIDVRLVNPNNVVVATSASVGSIFEKVRATSGLIPGQWKIRINGFSGASNQLVFWGFFQQM